MASRDEDARRRLTRMPRQGVIVAVLAIAGMSSSFMFTKVTKSTGGITRKLAVLALL